MLKNTIGIIISIFGGYIFNDLISLAREWTLERIKHKNQANLQIESYFRQLSGKDVRQVLENWVTLIDKTAEAEKTDDSKKSQFNLETYVKDLQDKTFMYGSSNTIKIYGEMMQHLYRLRNNPSENSKKNTNKTLLYTASIITSLKKDFTGYEVKPIEYLKIIITDLDVQINKEYFIDAREEVRKEILSTGANISL